MQQEMVRFRTGQSNAMHMLAKNAFEPMWSRTLSLIEDGIRSGELCNVDPMQMMYAALGANVFYFLSAPMVRLVTCCGPAGTGLDGCPAHRRRSNISAKPSSPTADAGARLAKPCSLRCRCQRHNPREKNRMKPRNRIFIIMGVLMVIALCWYFFSTKHTSDLQLIGTVDANEVIVSSRIQGRIQSLAVDEGQTSRRASWSPPSRAQDLAAARNAAEATVSGDNTSWPARVTRKNKRRATRPAR